MIHSPFWNDQTMEKKIHTSSHVNIKRAHVTWTEEKKKPAFLHMNENVCWEKFVKESQLQMWILKTVACSRHVGRNLFVWGRCNDAASWRHTEQTDGRVCRFLSQLVDFNDNTQDIKRDDWTLNCNCGNVGVQTDETTWTQPAEISNIQRIHVYKCWCSASCL